MSNLAIFPIAPGETVTAFALGPLEETYFPGEITRGTDNVDYVFINGFVDVGDLPCRIAVQNDIKARPTPTLEYFETTALNLPGFNRRLDLSGFWHVPHRLKRWARTRLFPAQSGNAPFEVTTCGGVHIWVDGVHITGFEPYQRNTAKSTNVNLPLRKEGSEIVLLIEEIAERDTNFYVELTWKGSAPLNSGLETSADPAAIKTLMELARSVRPTDVVFDGSTPLSLTFDQSAPLDVTIDATVGQSVHLSHKPPLFAATATFAKGMTAFLPGHLDGLPNGYHPLNLVFRIGETRVERSIGFALSRQKKAGSLAKNLTDRKKQALDFAAENGASRMGRVLAILASAKPLDDNALEALTDTLEGIEARRDCSDFVMVPLLWAFGEFAESIPVHLRERARSAILNYRYWMDEPGNDTMWFWSENHVLCFHVSEYIAGTLFPDETFPNSGLTGSQHRDLAEKRMARWYDSVEAHGLAEWNSAAYYPIDFIGLLAMHHWAQDDLKSRASGILDTLFTMIALHTSGGVSAGTMGRAYDKELRAGPLSELAPFAAVAFGKGWLNDGVAALPEFCAGTYEPPEGLSKLAAPAKGTAIEAHYVQGYGTAARLALHKTAHVQLSAAIDADAGSSGHQQHLVDVQFSAKSFARLWINHPGEDDPWGSNRPSYWAGNGVMPRTAMIGNRCLFLSDLGASPRLAFTHAYAPLSQFDEVEFGDDWMVLRAGYGAAILKATGPIVTQTRGPGAGIEHRVEGTKTGWVVVAGDTAKSLGSLCNRAQNMRLGFENQSLILSDPNDKPLRLDQEAGLFVPGRHHPFPTQEQYPQVTAPFAAPGLSENIE